MEGKAGPQVVSPFFQHQLISGRFYEPTLAAKRCAEPADSSWSWQQHQEMNRPVSLEGSKPNWNSNMWEWDGVIFAAKPTHNLPPAGGESSNGFKSQGPEILSLGYDGVDGRASNGPLSMEQKRKLEETTKPLFLSKDSSEEDDGDLALKLGGKPYSCADDGNSSRQNKRVRSGSPGNSYPMCQVDDCHSDLTGAKDYHRRHKVCQPHSKASKALVGNLMQRFCQQCSRFHPLQEFDEGKRSCRRRLAGHNRRRRKTQPEDALSRGLLAAASQENGGLGNLNIVNLISVLSRLQGNNGKASVDKDQFAQILSELILSSSSSERAVGLPRGFDLNVAHGLQSPSGDVPIANGQKSPSITAAESLAILSALTGSAFSSDALTTLLSKSLAAELASNFKAEHRQPPLTSAPKSQENNFQSPKSNLFLGPGMINVKSNSTPERGADHTIPSPLPLQLFTDSDRNNSMQNGNTRKYFSSDSSNPIDERSPSSSPPLMHKLFPLQSGLEIKENDSVSICKDDNVGLNASPSNDGCSTYSLSKVCSRSPPNFMSGSLFQGSESRSPILQAGYTSSSSGSDQSPASSNSDSHERTERITFKLFGRDPSNFPSNVRQQILHWLSHSPSDMESYIRPGCVILSIYTSMPLTSWEQQREDLQQRLKLLMEDNRTDFWRNGRVLVQYEHQLVIFNDGKFRLSRSCRSWNVPEIYYVQPVAVIAGQETTLTLRGHKLNAPGTKIHCAYKGKYISKEVPAEDSKAMTCGESMLTDHRVQTFKFAGGPANVLGRFFIEVEHGLKGNSFPVIVADPAICRELQSLECEIEGEFLEDSSCMISTEHPQEHSQDNCRVRTPSQDYSRMKEREGAVNFLNELGWLFQRSSRLQAGSHFANEPISVEFSADRFKYLFIYALERDWCALVKKLLDIFFEMSAVQEVPAQESSKVLLETNPLHRAVKRNCIQVVELLLNYDVSYSSSPTRCFIFPPNLSGPGGLTPLHLAASILNSDVLVDALTSDPQDVGLHSWNTVLDSSGRTPYAYALMRNNHSHNRLVERKWADRKNAQVSITILNTETPSKKLTADVNIVRSRAESTSMLSLEKFPQSCSQCVTLGNKKLRKASANQGILYRPYVHSMLAIAAVCVCVCLLFKGPPRIGSIPPFKWENIRFGAF